MSPSGITLLKLIGCGLMLADHVNKYWWQWRFEWIFSLGRLAMPIFVMVMAHHLARWYGDKQICLAKGKRQIGQLVLFGTISAIPYIGLGRTGPYLEAGYLPLNILFSLALGVAVIVCFRKGTPQSWLVGIALFAIGGAVVEYGWWLLLLMFTAVAYFRQPEKLTSIALLMALMALQVVNQNPWAVAAIVPVFLVSHYQGAIPKLPRLKWAFYLFYPVHLVLIWLVKIYGGIPYF